MYLHPLLRAHVSDQERQSLVKHIELRSFRRGEVVAHANEPTPHVFCVGSGLVRVTVTGASSETEVTTDFLRQDQFFFGDSLQADSYPPGATLIAALPSSVYLIPSAILYALCQRHAQIALELLEQQIRRTHALRQQLRKVTSLPADVLVGRVMHDLTHLAPSDLGSYDKRITQAVIASFTGLSREQVNRIVRDMESRGLVSKGKAGVAVPEDFASTDFNIAELGGARNKEREEGPLLSDPTFFPSSAQGSNDPDDGKDGHR